MFDDYNKLSLLDFQNQDTQIIVGFEQYFNVNSLDKKQGLASY